LFLYLALNRLTICLLAFRGGSIEGMDDAGVLYISLTLQWFPSVIFSDLIGASRFSRIIQFLTVIDFNLRLFDGMAAY
jgi:hypothetical protein